MAALTPMTELAAVNLILKNMGETKVNSLTGVLPLEASQAFDTLIEVSNEVQTPGWFFNREYRILYPDHQGNIYVPANTLHIETIQEHRHIRVTSRDKKVYNQTPFQNTFTFTGPLKVMLILGLAFEYLPASARSYIALRAARVMQVRELGDAQNLQEDTGDETRALAQLHAEQLAAEPLSLKSASNVYDVASGLPPLHMRIS
ncbi:hypothetical protein J1C56_02340 [Aminobacter anthyllidis]|uniref:Tail tubular protein A n=1 Tax=Aminobacter anthyllidis TaxID=1035067 RepID=A0A9X1A6X4_9HYPH|nr:hypothetical protein [Aminobacter anthyllidis]MBT1154424.1 hypothetical protein [Aminobacter anthyllidis]